MRLALLGNHADGRALARAMLATGRHELVVTDVPVPEIAPGARVVVDLEELLAEPNIDLVIVAGLDSVRAEQLRRTVQSEHDAACVMPVGKRADDAYEVALLCEETKRTLTPLLPERLHPAIVRLRELIRASGESRIIEWRRLTRSTQWSGLPWDAFRFLAGDIVEVSGLADADGVDPIKPLTIAGRFERGGLLHAMIVPNDVEEFQQWVFRGPNTIVTLMGPDADGVAMLRRRDSDGTWHDETWPATDCWALLAERIESARSHADEGGVATWADGIRYLELADAMNRSVEKRRTSGLEYQEINEEVGNKGTLTLIGCGLIWVILLIFGLSIWVPVIRWAVVPLLAGYLLLLAMSRVAKKSDKSDASEGR